ACYGKTFAASSRRDGQSLSCRCPSPVVREDELVNTLKPLLVVAVLAGIGYGVYVRINSGNDTPPPGVEDGWDSAPKVHMPDFSHGAPTAWGPGGGPSSGATPFNPPAAGPPAGAPPSEAPPFHAANPTGPPTGYAQDSQAPPHNAVDAAAPPQ